ncbi:MAG: type 4a pilus biogenesis protein PilO [Candidatus Riflebacteria bacterium]|nr:type 4a pilus biogenesis protein PilO [Candidatus Riflebacteria bacterium]
MAEEFNIQEWIQKAKEDPKNNVAPLIGIIFALLFGAYKLLYAPQATILSKQTKANKAISEQINGLQNAVANKDDTMTEVADLLKARSQVEAMCYKKSEAPLFLQEIRRLGKLVGIDIKSINPQPPIPKVFAETFTYEEYPVKINFSGSFQQLGLFLRVLEASPKLISIDLPTLLPDASGTIKLELTPTTILLPEPVATATAQ